MTELNFPCMKPVKSDVVSSVVMCSSSEEMRNILPKAVESLGLKIRDFISVLVMNKNTFGCSRRRQQISFAMEVRHCWG